MLDRVSVTAVVQVPSAKRRRLLGVPNLALRAERAPNLAGAELVGYGADWARGCWSWPAPGW